MRKTPTAANTAEALKARKRRWWKKNKDRMNNEVRAKPENRYNALKARARREKRRFQLTYAKYLEKIEAGCYYCGADLMDEVGGNVDRKNNDNRNYISQNLVGCCANCNKIKSDRLTAKEMKVGMRAIVRYRKNKS